MPHAGIKLETLFAGNCLEVLQEKGATRCVLATTQIKHLCHTRVPLECKGTHWIGIDFFSKHYYLENKDVNADFSSAFIRDCNDQLGTPCPVFMRAGESRSPVTL
jgi:hypothetical protein